MCSLWQDLSICTKIFDHVTLTVTFDLYLKNFNIVHNYSTVGDWAFIFHMGKIYMYSSWQDLSVRTKMSYLGTLTFNLHFKNFNLSHWWLLFNFCCRLVIFVVFWQLFLWLWNAKLIETQIFRELSIEIEISLIELKSSLIELKSSLNQLEDSLIQLDSSLIQ